MNFYKYFFMVLSIVSLFSDASAKSCYIEKCCDMVKRSDQGEDSDQFRRANVSANRLDVSGRMDARGESHFSGDAYYTGLRFDVQTSEIIFVGTMEHNGSFDNSGPVSLVGTVDVNGTLSVTGSTTLSGSVSIDGSGLSVSNLASETSPAAGYNFVIVDGSGNLAQVSQDTNGDTPSSRRYKKNIQQLDHHVMSDAVMKFEPVKYNYKKSPQKVQFGLIAEDISSLLPEAVVYNAQGQPDAINYQVVYIAMLDHVIQMSKRVEEMNEKVENNKDDIKSLNVKIKLLEAQLEELRSRFLLSEDDGDSN